MTTSELPLLLTLTFGSPNSLAMAVCKRVNSNSVLANSWLQPVVKQHSASAKVRRRTGRIEELTFRFIPMFEYQSVGLPANSASQVKVCGPLSLQTANDAPGYIVTPAYLPLALRM